jgi:hypothetical protein
MEVLVQLNSLDYWKRWVNRVTAAIAGVFIGVFIAINVAFFGPEAMVCSAVVLISLSLMSIQITNNHTEVIPALVAAGKVILIGFAAMMAFLMLFIIQAAISWGIYHHCVDARWIAFDYLIITPIAWYFLLTDMRSRRPTPQLSIIVV